jgi:hypothetical protein
MLVAFLCLLLSSGLKLSVDTLLQHEVRWLVMEFFICVNSVTDLLLPAFLMLHFKSLLEI